VESLSDPYEISSWVSYGLPQDGVSVENAVLVSRSFRYPLMMDPHGVGNAWVRGLEAENGLMVLNSSDSRMLTKLVSAVRTGTPTLIEDVAEIDSALLPLLSRNVVRQVRALQLKMDSYFILQRNSANHDLIQVWM